jgi:RNA polymerase sigma-70 factor (ECF subfamily)
MYDGDAPSTRASFLNRLKDPFDQPAWAAFVEAYKPSIDDWCRRQGLQQADADEVCNSVLAKVWNKMREFQYDPSRRFRGWLRRVVQNEVKDFWKRDRRRPGSRGAGGSNTQELLEQVEALPDDDPMAQALEELETAQERLLEAVQRVRLRVAPQTWQAWVSSVQQSQPAKEVAERLGISVASVYQAKKRINTMIREEFEGAGGLRGTPGGDRPQ